MPDVVIDGERLPVDPGAYPTASFTATFRCASGNSIPGEWVGVPVDVLLDDAGASPETTHLLVWGADGFTVCLPLVDAIDGVLAFERRPIEEESPPAATGTPPAGATASERDAADLPRFIAPAISGTRTVKDVKRIEPVGLDSDEDPEDYEDLRLGTPADT